MAEATADPVFPARDPVFPAPDPVFPARDPVFPTLGPIRLRAAAWTALLLGGGAVIVLLVSEWTDTRRPRQPNALPTYSVAEPVSLPRLEYGPASPPAVAVPAVREQPRAQASTGPDVAPGAAPGVAFNYRYAFRLPTDRIAAVQEQHARTCEQLGTSRCRIIGMRYRVLNHRDVEAMLAFKLAPNLARRFGREGGDLVARADGMLIDSEISGIDVGTTIRAAGRNIAEMTEELERLEARLHQRGLTAAERSQLADEAEQLRQSIRALRADREEQQESLATTPMVFQYASGDLVPNLDSRPSFGRSAARAWDNFERGIGVLFIILVTLLPWAALALLGWGTYRIARRRSGPRPGEERAFPPAENPAG